MYRQLESKMELSRAQFDAARLGFFQTLRRKRMSQQFVERHAEDLFAQACFEYSRRVSDGIEIGDPPAWIVTCGWHRTVGLLETRDWRPRLVSTESIAEPPDDEDVTPEGTFLAEDRSRKVREAVEQLPAYQRRLLALSYFEGESIREAARRLHWTASKAQRAHEAAQKRIHDILGVESTDDLQLEIGLFAFLTAVAEHASGHPLPAGLEAVLDSAHRTAAGLGDRAGRLIHAPVEVRAPHPARLVERVTLGASGETRGGRGPLRKIGDLGRRFLAGGATEAGAVASGESASRAIEVCKGLAICAIGGGALTGVLIGGHHHHERPIAHRLPVARITHDDRHDPVPPRRVPAADTVVPSAPEPRTSTEAHTSTSKGHESSHAGEVAPQVDEAAPAEQTPAAHHEVQEAEVEELFGDIDSTEASGAESNGASGSGSVADSATTANDAPTTPGGGANPERQAEEAGAAKEIHGLLE